MRQYERDQGNLDKQIFFAKFLKKYGTVELGLRLFCSEKKGNNNVGNTEFAYDQAE